MPRDRTAQQHSSWRRRKSLEANGGSPAKSLFSAESRNTSDPLTEDQGMDLIGALIGAH